MYDDSLLNLAVPQGVAMDVFGRVCMARAAYLAGLNIPVNHHQDMRICLEQMGQLHQVKPAD